MRGRSEFKFCRDCKVSRARSNARLILPVVRIPDEERVRLLPCCGKPIAGSPVPATDQPRRPCTGGCFTTCCEPFPDPDGYASEPRHYDAPAR